MIEDAELLRRYAETKSEAAFAEFVQRRVDFVYGCALRRVGGDAHHAQDVTQQVFVAAGRDAARLARHPVVTGWLFTATRNVAAQLVRAERRRHAREQEAHAMDEIENQQQQLEWERLRPVLDDALDELGEEDREAVLLRFFEGKSFAEVGVRLRVGENAARMRVSRALEKMSVALGQRGVTSTAAALAAALALQPGIAAPAGLAAAATGAALAGSAGVSAGVTASAAAATSAAVFMGMTKLQIGVASALVAVGAAGYAVQTDETSRMAGEIARAQQQQTAAEHALRTENQQLKQEITAGEAQQLAAADELGRLKREEAELRRQIAAMDRARQAALEAASAKTGMRVYDLAALDVKPQPKQRTAPKYPAALRQSGVQGEATVDFIVDPQGVVRNATILKATHPELGEAAVAAVQQWVFAPGEKDGRTVATHMQVPIVFTLSNDQAGAAKGDGVKRLSVPWF